MLIALVALIAAILLFGAGAVINGFFAVLGVIAFIIAAGVFMYHTGVTEDQLMFGIVAVMAAIGVWVTVTKDDK